MTTVKVQRPCDPHTHLRSPAQYGQLYFEYVVRENTSYYSDVIVEPNTFLDERNSTHHIETADDAEVYKKQIIAAMDVGVSKPHARVHLLIKLTPRTTPEIITDAASIGAIGVKLYPEGVTTGSEHGGVENFFSNEIFSALAELERRDMVLQIHPEMPYSFCMRAEFAFGHIIRRYRRDFPGLRIFVEHVTDRRTIDLVNELPRVWGTITGHHPYLTLDDVLGCNDHFCRPNAKEPEDKRAIRAAATSGNKKFISITDSAWHPAHLKHPRARGVAKISRACAGVFNPASSAIPLTARLFEEELEKGLDVIDVRERFELFMSRAAREAYRFLDDPFDTITLVEKPWIPKVEVLYEEREFTPFCVGEEFRWRIA